MNKSDIIAGLMRVIGADAILSDAQMAALDWVIDPANAQGLVAVAPNTLAQIAAVFSFCNDKLIPIVPQGGRTGLAGGASATGVEILLLGHKMPQEITVDAKSQTVRVSAHTSLADLEAAVRVHGLTVGIDIAARDTATIGGMISTNAGGMEAFRNGTMRQRVLGLRAVLPDSSILDDLACVRKCNEGYDVKQLLIGAEGTLGCVMTAVLQLLPAPPEPATFLLALPDAAAGLSVLVALQEEPGISILRAEAMWRSFAQENAKHQAVNPLRNLPDAPLFVIYEVHCVADNAEEVFFSALEGHFEKGVVLDAVAAQSGQQAGAIWQLREDTMTMGTVYPHSVAFDVSVPLAHLDRQVKTIAARVAAVKPGLRVHVLGHLADGNLHYSIVDDGPISAGLAAAIKPAVLDGLKEIGGSFSAEHGIGTEKRDALFKYGDAGKLAVMRAIKQVIDPNNICNPGKVI